MEKFTREDFLAKNTLERIFFRRNWGELFKRGGVIFLTSNTIKYILQKVVYSENYTLYKVVQENKIYNIKSSLGGQSIYYKK